MKVRELILQLDVLCYIEDDALLASKHGFRLLNILTASEVEGEMVRSDDQIPSIKFGKGQNSQKYALIEVASEF